MMMVFSIAFWYILFNYYYRVNFFGGTIYEIAKKSHAPAVIIAYDLQLVHPHPCHGG